MNTMDSFIAKMQSLSEVFDVSSSLHFRKCFLDYLGCVVAGTKMLKDPIGKLCQSGIMSVGPCTVFGNSTRYSIKDAAFINGMLSHVLELDDGHRIATMHLAAPIFSAMLAVAEYENLTSSDFFRGCFIGYETAIRLSCSMQPYHKKRGFHTTGTCGTLGVAMAVANSMRFDFKQTKSALSAAISSAAGVLEMLSDDSQLKPYNVGRAAMDGIQAAYVGKAGFEPPLDALWGKRGFFATMTPEWNTSYLTEFDLDHLLSMGTFFKPYAACRHCHPAIEASIALRRDCSFYLSDITKIVVKTYDLAIVGHDHTVINGANSAKMSIPYCVAIGLVEGDAGLAKFSEDFYTREDITQLTSKVYVEENASLSALIPNKRAAIVELYTRNEKFSKRVDIAKGEPENPMTQSDIELKFIELATSAGVSIDNANEVISEIQKPDFSISKIINLLSKND